MPNVKEVIGLLEEEYNPEDVIAVAIWQRDDVLCRAKEREISVTMEQADDIIDRIHRRQDATLGINWDTIDAYLEDL